MEIIRARTRASEGGYMAVPVWNEKFWSARYQDVVKERLFVERLGHYRRFSDLYRVACEVIHGIPGLYENVGLENIAVYLGRSSKNSFLENCRWKSLKEYEGCIAFATTDDDCYKRHEKLAIDIALTQKRLRALCVKDVLNKRAHAGGAEPDSTPILYVAWKIRVSGEVGWPDVKARAAIIETINCNEHEQLPNAGSLERALQAAKRIGTSQSVYWPAEFRN